MVNPEPETNIEVKTKDVVYLWESASKKPKRAGHLVARGKVTQTPNAPVEMPVWQRALCVDKATGQSSELFHSTMPRAAIVVERCATKRVDRNDTDPNLTLRKHYFLKKRGLYTKTIFTLTECEAQELDKLACW